ncbi:ring-cleaving dioxygenase [Terriglobus tenax]|uniref:ring-cleaving dioxygenase n=1 Tax=Terriglobus tenax TaxID=1111115 RepID=UPI0021DF504C|nr:ring-cleaving dioxygenase [Terriglobus tenax]
MATPIVGLHHVTAIASDPQKNLDFYTGVLGLRFVKRTVNFDDPGTYHFYFGDDTGTPGTILTFFPWPGMSRGRAGTGETIATAFSIPVGSLDYWRNRLAEKQVAVTEETYFGKTYLTFPDPDGMVLELVENTEAQPVSAPRYADVPAEYAIQGFFSTTLLELSLLRTESLLDIMGYKKVAEEGDRVRYTPEGNARGRFLDIVVDPAAQPGRMGAGTVHHIAFRAADDAAQVDWQKELSPYVGVTPVQDRTYFHSIYFREPGGVLFEIATDAPGFLIDEDPSALGEALKIPAWFEPQRAAIEARVKPITLHKFNPATQEVK